MKPSPSLPPRIELRIGAPRQRGIVLFITLIALVVLLLASVALMRSVDTASMIAGNLAFKLSTVAASDNALANTAMRQLTDMTALGPLPRDVWTNPANALNATNATTAYYATIDADSDGIEDIAGVEGTVLMSSAWIGTADSAPDAFGNSFSYIIQRMCRGPTGVLPNVLNCLTNTSDPPGRPYDELPGIELSGTSLLYRITLRIRGPRNSVSYVQAFVY